jgi:hypothetical protein
LVLIVATLIFSSQLALAQFTQQGPKLVGTGAVGNAEQGYSVSLSADGKTAIVGGPVDNVAGFIGAAWVYTRNGSIWAPQGGKLTASDVGPGQGPQFGIPVSLSADGNTAIIGGNRDNNFSGAAWVFTRSNGVWTQQGSKLVAADAVGAASQGYSVALSADGNTATVGGNSDNGGVGAAWIYTRTGGAWTQQSKLVGSGAIGLADQGYSVALSGDGDTAIVGGQADNGGIGAAWV